MSRKQDILKAATELFSQNGYHGTSTHQVAKCADVSEGIIFYYFKTKEDILLEIFYNSFDNFLDEICRRADEAPTGLDALHAWVQVHADAIVSRAQDVLLLVRDFPASLMAEGSPHRDQIIGRIAKLDQTLRDMIIRGQRDGSVRPCDPKQTAWILRGLLIGATRVAMLESHDNGNFLDALWKFCLRALSPNPNQALL